MMDFAPLRLATEDLPERDRRAVWREVVSRALLRVDAEPLPDFPFQVVTTLRALPGLKMMSCVTSALRMRRTEEIVADNTGEIGLVVNLEGYAVVSQRGQDVALGVGDAVAISNLDPASLMLRGTRHIGLQVPCAALAPLVPDLEDRAARRIPHDHEALRLLVPYLLTFQAASPLATAELRQLAVTHVHDLLALTLGATRDGAAIAQERGMRAARLAAIKADVIAHIGHHDFSVSAVAVRHQVSPRYVQRLFESEGITFSQFVLERRLALAHRMLSDPRHAGMTVSAIALVAGLGDLSHFNRSFRRRYGATPSDVRAAGLGREG